METLHINNEMIYYNAYIDNNYQIGINIQTKNLGVSIHRHDYIEIVCQVNGSSCQIVDDITFTLQSGDIYIITPEQTHINEPSSSDVINIIIPTTFLTYLIMDSAFDPLVVYLKNSLTNNVHISSYKLNSECYELVKRLFNNITTPSVACYYMKQRLLISTFLLAIAESIEFQIKEINKADIDIITYIQENLSTASLTEYSKLNHYTTSTLSQKVKKEYNMSFIEILHENRLNRAAFLLQSTNIKISRIIDEIGYQNKSHFYKLFKQKYNLTPHEFRLQYTIIEK